MAYLFSLLFIFVPLTWLPNTSELFEFNKIILTYILTGLIGGIWVIRMIREKRIIFRRTILDIPIILLLVSSLLSLSLSIDPRISWYGYYSRWNGGLQSLISYSLLYWAFVSNMNKKNVMSNVQCLMSSAIIVSVYGILEHFGHSISCLLVAPSHAFDVSCWVQDVQNRVYATLGQPNWMAAYLVSLMFIPISKMINHQGSIIKESRPQKLIIDYWSLIINLLVFILMFTALLFTKSRSGLLAFGISSLVFWGMQFGKKTLLPMALFGILVSTLLISFQNPIRDLFIKNNQSSIINNQGTSLETGGTESGSIRKIVWDGAIKIWLGNTKNFLIGTGPETFALSYYQYRPIKHNATSEWELLYNKAHNEFLNYLATTGIFGLLSYLLFLFTAGWVLIKPQTPNPKSQSLGFEAWSLRLALFAGFISITVTNFWGFSVVITQIFLFLFPALSIIINDQESIIKKTKNDIGGKQVLGILGVTLIIGYWLLMILQYWNNDRLYAKAQNHYRYFASTNKTDYLFSSLDLAQKAFVSSREPAMAIDLANYAALVSSALVENNSTAAAQLAKISSQAANFAQTSSPNNPSYLKSISKSQIILNNFQAAYQTLLLAQKLSPTDPKIPYSLGVVSLNLNKINDAKMYFEKALLLKSDWPDPQKQLDLLK